MAFADLKNDFVFRRVFLRRPDLLCALLNDLLERTGERTIEEVERFPTGEPLPVVEGARLSMLDVRCRDWAGTTFVVEMQLLHVDGFGNRAIYNACRSYSDQLREGQHDTKPADVVAVSICEFELWPDAEQDAAKQPRVPMLSRWSTHEQSSGVAGLLQVQYAFLELPKLPAARPTTGAAYWAWLFVHAPELTEVPADMPPGPHREALELANEASFSAGEREAYRRVMDEIQQAREYGEAQRAEGLREGEAKGEARGLRAAVLDLCEAFGIELGPEQRTRLEAMGVGELETLRQAIKQTRRWPA